MKVFLDTNVLVAAMTVLHTVHDRALAVLESVLDETNEGVVAAHTLAETYAILTNLPPPSRHSPEQALMSIEENIIGRFQTVSLTGFEYAAMIREAARMRIHGGTIYDAVILKCAAKGSVDRIYTFNLKHFQAIAPPGLAAILLSP